MEICVICNSEFIKKAKSNTCSISCRNKLAYRNGRKVIRKSISNYEGWIQKYGVEEADRRQALYKENMSKAINEADMSLQRQTASLLYIERNKKNKGKSLEEIYGEEKAKEIKKKLSNSRRGEKNPSFGKVRSGGRSVKGYYKGKFFRSLLELSFMKYLEDTGLVLTDIDYECFKVPWIDERGTNRTYTIDFYVPSLNTVYEVKQSWALKTNEVILKSEFANRFFKRIGLHFMIVTENDFKKLKFEDVLNDSNVIFLQKSLKSFKGNPNDTK